MIVERPTNAANERALLVGVLSAEWQGDLTPLLSQIPKVTVSRHPAGSDSLSKT